MPEMRKKLFRSIQFLSPPETLRGSEEVRGRRFERPHRRARH